MMSGRAAMTSAAETIRSLAFLRAANLREHLDAAGGLHQFRHPAEPGNHRLVPFLEIDARMPWQAQRYAHARHRRGRRVVRPVPRPFPAAPTSAPSVRIMSRMPATSRWLKACTATLARTSSATMSACKSEKVEHQVGLEREDLRHVGGDEGGDTRLFLAHARRAHGVAGDADDAGVLAEEIERLDGFLGQADDSRGREHARSIASVQQFHPAGRSSPGPRRA